jgi:S1-C subfamily serine protease
LISDLPAGVVVLRVYQNSQAERAGLCAVSRSDGGHHSGDILVGDR